MRHATSLPWFNPGCIACVLIACGGCLADCWVMRAWAKALGVDQHKVMLLADGDAIFHTQLGESAAWPGVHGMQACALYACSLWHTQEPRASCMPWPRVAWWPQRHPDCHQLHTRARMPSVRNMPAGMAGRQRRSHPWQDGADMHGDTPWCTLPGACMHAARPTDSRLPLGCIIRQHELRPQADTVPLPCGRLLPLPRRPDADPARPRPPLAALFHAGG